MPVERRSYCFGVPYKGSYTEVFNSTSADGSPITNGTVKSVDTPMHGFEQSICVDIPAFSVMYFTVKKAPQKKKSESGGKKTAAVKKVKKTADKADK